MAYLSTENGSAYMNTLAFGYTFGSPGEQLLQPDLGNNLPVIVFGNVTANTFIGNGSGLNWTTSATPGTYGSSSATPTITVDSNGRISSITTSSIATTLEAIVNNGNTTSNTVQFTNAGNSLITTGNIGIANSNPLNLLSIGANTYVSPFGIKTIGSVSSGNFFGNIVGSNTVSATTLYGTISGSNAVVGTHYGPVTGSNTMNGSVITASTALVGTHYGPIVGSNNITAINISGGNLYGPLRGVNNVSGYIISGITLVGTIVGANAISAGDITGLGISGTTLSGPIVGSNAISGSVIHGTTLYGALAGSNAVNAFTISGTTLYGSLAGSNAVNASTISGTTLYGSLAGSNTVNALTISGTTLYGTLAGSNTVSASTLYGTLSGSNTVSASTIYGTLTGSNTVSASALYGTLAGSNTVNASTISGTDLYGTVKGSNTISGTFLYGVIDGSNTVSASTMYGVIAGANTISGSSISGTDLFGTIKGSNTVSASTLYGTIDGSNAVSASVMYGVIAGANTISGSTISGTDLYGTIKGSNTVSASTLFGTIAGSNNVTAGIISGSTLVGPLYGSINGSNTISASRLSVAGAVDGSNFYGNLVGSNTVSASNIITTGNVGIANSYLYKTLSIAANTFIDDVGSNTVVTLGNISASYYHGNANMLVSLTGAGAATYGNNYWVPQVIVDVTGRITDITNVQIRTRLTDVTNFGNATSNTILFTNTGNSLLAYGNVSIGTSAITSNTLTVGSNLWITDAAPNVLVTTGNILASYYSGNASKLTWTTSATPGTYGSSSQSPVITIDADGRVSSVTNAAITIATPTLDQVANTGNTTSNSISIGGLKVTSLVANGVPYINSTNTLATSAATFYFTQSDNILHVNNDGGVNSRILVRGIFQQTTSKGQPVYIQANQNQEVHFHLANNESITTMPCVGVALTDYASLANAFVTTNGSITGLVTADTFVEGSLTQGANGDIGKPIYVSNTPGKFTITRPYLPNQYVQDVGTISRVYGGGGSIVDIIVQGSGQYIDNPNQIIAYNANIYTSLSVGGPSIQTGTNLYVTGNAYFSSGGLANVVTVDGNVSARTFFGNVIASTVVGTLYGPVSGSNVVSGSTLVGPLYGSVNGANNIITTGGISGTNLYGTIAGANNVTAGIVSGTTLVGPLYGSVNGANNIITTGGISGTNLYGTIAGANNIITTGGISGTNLYGTIAGANNVTAGIVSGTTLVGPLYGSVNGSNAITAGTISGTTLVGPLYGSVNGAKNIITTGGRYANTLYVTID